MYFVLILAFLILPIIGFFVYKQYRVQHSAIRVVEFLFILGFIGTIILFGFGCLLNDNDYFEAIDIVDEGYSPFAFKHVLTLIVFSLLAMFGLIKLWLQGRAMPPLMFVLAIIFVLIGVPLSIAILIQVSSNANPGGGAFLFVGLPLIYIVTSIIVLFKVVSEEVNEAAQKVYQNRFLQYINQKLANTTTQPYWVFILLFPVFIIIVAMLMLFGQDAQSVFKVFTDTTTWNFSEKTHPPFLDHKGHYLCTVAACGSPEVVKPIRLGKRHGLEIIVNRQLQVANAFEELIQENAPTLHRLIRKMYDQYGYPLSKKINTKRGSNLTYYLMKPLEYGFLFVLYLFSCQPEQKIAKQYAG